MGPYEPPMSSRCTPKRGDLVDLKPSIYCHVMGPYEPLMSSRCTPKRGDLVELNPSI